MTEHFASTPATPKQWNVLPVLPASTPLNLMPDVWVTQPFASTSGESQNRTASEQKS